MRGRINQKGFTLTEALVVGIIGAVIATIFLTFMSTHNTALNEGVAMGDLVMKSEIVSARIARSVRSANLVVASDESWSTNPWPGVRDYVTHIVLYNGAGTQIGTYNIPSSGQCILSEGGVDFKVAGDPVVLGPGSVFKLSADRKEVTLKLNYVTTYRGTKYTTPAKGDTYRCRN
jgi:hypothetical protein